MLTPTLHIHDATRFLLEGVLKTVTDEQQRVNILVDALDSLLSTKEAKALPSFTNYQARRAAAAVRGFGEADLMNTIIDVFAELTQR